MGMSSGKRGKRRGMSEINVTPLVDVMLVLLIIFMVTAPMLTTSVNVNLPAANSGSSTSVEKPIVVSIQEDGKVYLGNQETSLEELPELLQQATNSDKTKVIQLRGDGSLEYGKLMKVMDNMRAAGFTSVALITVP